MIQLILILFSFYAISEPLVGIVDSGIDSTHPLFKNTKINFKSFINEDKDTLGHGTHVSGIFLKLSKAKNFIVIQNISKKNQLSSNQQIEKTIDSLKFKEVIDFAIKNKVNILNFSQVTNIYDNEMIDSFKKAKENGILIIASAGNDKMDLSFFDKYPELSKSNIYPCSLPFDNIICVGSISEEGLIKSNYSKKHVDVFALGENVYSSLPNAQFGFLSGSSMATPKITALAYLTWRKSPKSSYLEIKNKLFKSLTYDSRFKPYSKTSRYFKE